MPAMPGNAKPEMHIAPSQQNQKHMSCLTQNTESVFRTLPFCLSVLFGTVCDDQKHRLGNLQTGGTEVVSVYPSIHEIRSTNPWKAGAPLLTACPEAVFACHRQTVASWRRERLEEARSREEIGTKFFRSGVCSYQIFRCMVLLETVSYARVPQVQKQIQYSYLQAELQSCSTSC